MDVLNIRQRIKETEARLKTIGDNATSDIASDALNDVMFYGRAKVKQHMKDVFDKPTPRTLNSILYRMATAQNPEAKLWINDDTTKGASPAQWLAVQEAGGVRKDKRVENWLQNARILKDNEQVYAMQPDSRGNMKGGDVTKMLSALQAGDPWQWSRDKAKQSGFRIARRKVDGMPFGIFKMQGVHSKLFLLFTRKQTYRKRFKFREVLQEAWNKKIDGAYAKAWAKHVQKSLRPIG